MNQTSYIADCMCTVLLISMIRIPPSRRYDINRVWRFNKSCSSCTKHLFAGITLPVSLAEPINKNTPTANISDPDSDRDDNEGISDHEDSQLEGRDKNRNQKGLSIGQERWEERWKGTRSTAWGSRCGTSEHNRSSEAKESCRYCW
jgi:hypothetical protein